MKKRLMDILVCPVCKGQLILKAMVEDGEEVVSGSLLCQKCNFDYPIEDTIPNLLPPELQDKK